MKLHPWIKFKDNRVYENDDIAVFSPKIRSHQHSLLLNKDLNFHRYALFSFVIFFSNNQIILKSHLKFSEISTSFDFNFVSLSSKCYWRTKPHSVSDVWEIFLKSNIPIALLKGDREKKAPSEASSDSPPSALFSIGIFIFTHALSGDWSNERNDVCFPCLWFCPSLF